MTLHSNSITTIGRILSTFDYSIFTSIQGNRIVNEIHVERLKKSFKENYLLSPIIVNEKYQIIDGQHRFMAAKSLKLPINFIVIPNYGLKQVQVLNANASNWSNYDYLNAYCDLGYEQYLQMRQFMNDFPDFGIASADVIITNSASGSNSRVAKHMVKINGKRRGSSNAFKDGKLHIPNLEKSYANAEKIMMLKQYHESYNKRPFVACMVQIFEIPDYDHKQLLSKLKLRPNALVHCSRSSQYKLVIEDIYNYRSRNKISLRF